MKGVYITFVVFSVFAISSCKSKPQKNCVANLNPDCACAMIYQPVCGCDGKTYGNACEAGCSGIDIVSQGECK